MRPGEIIETSSPISPISSSSVGVLEGATGRGGAGIEARQRGTSVPGGDQGTGKWNPREDQQISQCFKCLQVFTITNIYELYLIVGNCQSCCYILLQCFIIFIILYGFFPYFVRFVFLFFLKQRFFSLVPSSKSR